MEEAELDADFLWRLSCFFSDFLLWCPFDFLLWRFFLVFLPFLLEGRFFLAARLLSPLLLSAELSVSEEELESLLDSRLYFRMLQRHAWPRHHGHQLCHGLVGAIWRPEHRETGALPDLPATPPAKVKPGPKVRHAPV